MLTSALTSVGVDFCVDGGYVFASVVCFLRVVMASKATYFLTASMALTAGVAMSLSCVGDVSSLFVEGAVAVCVVIAAMLFLYRRRFSSSSFVGVVRNGRLRSAIFIFCSSAGSSDGGTICGGGVNGVGGSKLSGLPDFLTWVAFCVCCLFAVSVISCTFFFLVFCMFSLVLLPVAGPRMCCCVRELIFTRSHMYLYGGNAEGVLEVIGERVKRILKKTCA